MAEEKRQKGKKPKRRIWVTVMLIVLLLGLAGIGALTVVLYSFGSYDDQKLHNDPQTTLVFDRDGQPVLQVHGAQNRLSVSLDQLPHNLIQAFLAAEDLRFYDHVGFDIIRIGGALWADIRSGSLSQGASTITQQLIKNTHLTPEKTWTRKLQEAWYAFQVEQDYSKDEILLMYMNHVYLGNGAYGVQAAAQAYFGKEATDLTLAECASIAAILKAPSNYSPHIQPENNQRRRNTILGTMLEEHMISESDYQKAAAAPITLAETEDEQQHGWFTDAVLEEAREKLGIEYEELLGGGYRIQSTMDTALQRQVEQLFDDAALFPPDADDGTPAQAALAVTDVETGQVRALIGGRAYETRRGLNRATQMRRQPGSTFKPFAVYAPAIEQFGLTSVTFLDDSPTDFDGYAPGNYGGAYRGWVTMRTALARSINVPAVQILNQIGVQAGMDSAARFGFQLDANDGYLPLALGAMTYGVTPLELSGAYAALGNQGTYTQPYTVLSIQDSEGNVLYTAKPVSSQALSSPAAEVLTDLLQSAANWGTGSKIGATGLAAAAKTGTVSFQGDLNRDAWTAAYTPKTAISVWMGFDTTDSAHALPKAVTGGALPAQLATKVLTLAQKESVPFPASQNVLRVDLDKRALETEFRALLATDITPPDERQREVFLPGTEPTAQSEYWQVPRTPADFSVTQGMGGYPEIRFTILDASARYRLYRQGDSESAPTEIKAFTGQPNEVVIYNDPTVQRGESYTYILAPEHAEAADAGMAGAVGRQTEPRTYRMSSFPFNFPFSEETEPPELTEGPDIILTTPPPSSPATSPTPVATATTEPPQVTTPAATPVIASTPKPTQAPTPKSTPKPTPTGPMFGFAS